LEEIGDCLEEICHVGIETIKFLHVGNEKKQDKNILTGIQTWHLPNTGLDRHRCIASRGHVRAEYLTHIHFAYYPL
jgi:hypothetical protein